MQKRQDHIPVRLSCLFGLRTKGGTSPSATFKRKACRPNDLDPSLDQGLFLDRLRSQALPAWDTDVDSHFAQLVREWQEAGRAVTSRTPAPPRQSFLTEATLQLVEVRKGIRLYLKQEEAELRCRYTRIGFGAFFLNVQGRSVDARAGRQVERWLRDIHISIARAWSFLGHTCRALRDAVRTDRNRYLDQLARDVGLADVSCPQQLYRRVRKAFPKAATSRRTKFTSLPAVELLDGSLAPTNAAKEQRWREHFAEQESGVPVDAQKFQHLLTAADAHRSGAAVCFDSAMLPSLLSLETTILGLQRAKAAGADGITAELLRVAPLDSARRLVSLHLKSTLTTS